MSMLHAVYPAFAPTKTKLHLAQSNGLEHPMDVFEAGHFDEWQSAQTARNFNRPFVATLIATAAKDVWLFAGLWQINGPPVIAPHTYDLRVARESHWKRVLGARATGLNLN